MRHRTQIWVHVQLGSSCPHCTNTRTSPPLIPTIGHFGSFDLVSSSVCWEAETNISISHCASRRGFSVSCLASVSDGQCSMADLRPKDPRLRLGHLWVGELHYCDLWHLWIALDLAVQFNL